MKHGITERNNVIFDLVVRSYIDTAEPVGSRTISRHFDIGLSSASVRNVMSDLEEQGYLKQPHTSAGRVPTDLGYRYWVDSLMQQETLGEREKDRIQDELRSARSIETLAEKICKAISEMTGNVVIVYVKNLKRISFLNHLLSDLVESEKLADFFEEEPELFIDGASRIFEQPEFQDLAKMRVLLHAFDEKEDFLNALMGDLIEEEGPGARGVLKNGVNVRIGSENDLRDLEDVSLVTKDCYLSRTPVGGVAIVGPTRMKYPKVMAAVDYVADSVSELVGRF